MYNLFFNGHNAVLTIGINMCCATDIFGIKIAYLLTYLLWPFGHNTSFIAVHFVRMGWPWSMGFHVNRGQM